MLKARVAERCRWGWGGVALRPSRARAAVGAFPLSRERATTGIGYGNSARNGPRTYGRKYRTKVLGQFQEKCVASKI